MFYHEVTIEVPKEHEGNQKEKHKESELKPLLQLVILIEIFDDENVNHEAEVQDEGDDDPVEDLLFAVDFEGEPFSYFCSLIL